MPATEETGTFVSSIRRRCAKVRRAAEDAPLFGRILRDKSVRSALTTFALTRAMVFILFIATAHAALMNEPRTPSGLQEIEISLYKIPFARDLRALALRGDGGWYFGIAREGYEHRPFDASAQHNWAFFPLYPLLVRLVTTLTGDPLPTGVALSNLFLLLALCLLHKTTLAWGFDEADADRAILYIACYPMSYFFSLFMTESLFLLLTVWSFYAARRERWWLAGVLGALASATRLSGILLLPILLILYWQQHGKRLSRSVLWLFLIPSGLLAFTLYLYSITGNAFAFRDVQGAWARRPGLFLLPLYEYIKDPLNIAQSWDFRLMNFAAAMLVFVCAFILIKRREWSLGLYTLASVILPLSSSQLQSTARYSLVIFPVFIVLAVAGRTPRADRTILVLFVTLLSLMTVLFAAHFSLALS